MPKKPTPQEILESTSPSIRKLFSAILKIEQEYQHFRNLSAVKDKERELCERIVKLIDKEVRP